MKYIKYISTTVASVALMFSVLAVPKSVSATQEKVDICHRTNSASNPYVKLNVSVSAVDGIAGNSGGEKDHFGEHKGDLATSVEVATQLKKDKIDWGDIIPPIDGVHDGLNWADGEEILKNNCGFDEGHEEPKVVEPAVTFVDPTCNALGSYTIPATKNVEYSVGGDVVSAGTYQVANGTTVTVVAEANEGYYIADETTDTWTKTFTAPTDCGSGGGQVLSDQVTVVPAGSVNAGGGGTSASATTALGFVGSIATLAIGLVLRKRLV